MLNAILKLRKTLFIISALIATSCSNTQSDSNSLIQIEAELHEKCEMHVENCDHLSSWTKGKQDSEKRNYIKSFVDSIDLETVKIFSLIEGLKLDLLKKSNENLTVSSYQDLNAIIWSKYSKKKPLNLSSYNLTAINDKQNLNPSQEIFIASSNQPSKKGLKLSNQLKIYRKRMLELCYGYQWLGKKEPIKILEINNYDELKDLRRKINQILPKHKLNHQDRALFINVYVNLTRKDKSINPKSEHWICANFNNTTIIEALTNLTLLQEEILNARSIAFDYFENHYSTGDYQAHNISSMISGPKNVRAGEVINLSAAVVYYDFDNMPVLKIDNVENPKLKYSNGQVFFEVKAKGGKQNFKGTIGVRNRIGEFEYLPWEWTVNE